MFIDPYDDDNHKYGKLEELDCINKISWAIIIIIILIIITMFIFIT